MLDPLLTMLAVLGLAAFLFCVAMLFRSLIKGTPRACAFPGCTTNHWNLEKFCSHHILDQDDGDGC